MSRPVQHSAWDLGRAPLMVTLILASTLHIIQDLETYTISCELKGPP
jgi:hypothetical protein